jgi:hypothetical protein
MQRSVQAIFGFWACCFLFLLTIDAAAQNEATPLAQTSKTKTPDSLFVSNAGEQKVSPTPAPAQTAPAKWYDKMTIRGYSQFRYNRLMDVKPDVGCEACNTDPLKSNSFEFRRARLILSSNLHERFSMYIQFDYSADGANGNKNYLQLRDAYGDIFFDKKQSYRLRVGQSKVPFGFENTQSSSNRLPLDRAESLNSAAPNERDMGAFFYWVTPRKRQLFRSLLEHHQKGSGDYGLFSIGMYNGQGTNKADLNDKLHVVSRLCWPFELGKDQILEPAIQAYTGQFTIAKEQLSTGTKTNKELTYSDRRVAGSLMLYPRPFGIMAEWNTGQGPAFDTQTDSIVTRRLNGGYVMFNYRKVLKNDMILIPYVRWQTYQGGRKVDLDARYYNMKETELGIEFTPNKYVEITLAYANSHRITQDKKADIGERRNTMRLQVQLNY